MKRINAYGFDNKGSLNKNIDLSKGRKGNIIIFSIKVNLDELPYLNKYLNIHFPKYNEELGNMLLIPFNYFYNNSFRVLIKLCKTYDNIVIHL